MKPCQRAAAAALILFVTACGNSAISVDEPDDGPPVPPKPPSGTEYVGLISTEAVTSELSGATLAESGDFFGTVTSAELRRLAGTLSHSDRALVLTDGVYLLNDPDGPDEFGLLTDGNSAFEARGLSGGDYRFVTVLNGSYPNEEDTVFLNGVFGVMTQGVDIPLSGTARYSGMAEATGEIAGDFVLLRGNSAVRADFGSGALSATLDGFVDGDGAVVYFDRVELENMLIADGQFTGGDKTLYLGDLEVAPQGDNPVSSVLGHFFGFDTATGLPPEVGGAFLTTGDDGRIGVIFLGQAIE